MTPSAADNPRVAFVLDFLNSGGAERAALNMADAAPRSDCRVVAEWRGGDLADAPEAAAVTFASGSAARPGRILRIARLSKTLRELRPDVVVSMLSPVVTAAAARACGAGVIHWLQAPWSETTKASSGGAASAAERAMLRLAVAGRAIVAAATPGLCDECLELGVPQHKLALLPNGLRLPVASEKSRRDNHHPPTIVTVGRLEAPKRHDLTIRAVARIADRRPVRLVVVGSGRDESSLRALAAEVGLRDQVTFTGFVEDPHEPLRAADVFVLATEYEGFGNVIVEALSEGLPVVVSDVPYGPGFILDEGRYGTLATPGSVEALAEALTAAIERAPLDDGSAEAARARASSFALERVADRFEKLVDVVASGQPVVPASYREWQ